MKLKDIRWDIVMIVTAAVLIVGLILFAKTCDDCHKQFYGAAYYGPNGTETWCDDCARDYWSQYLLPYQNYRK